MILRVTCPTERETKTETKTSRNIWRCVDRNRAPGARTSRTKRPANVELRLSFHRKFCSKDEALGHLIAEAKAFLVSMFRMMEGEDQVFMGRATVPDYWKKDKMSPHACAALMNECCTF